MTIQEAENAHSVTNVSQWVFREGRGCLQVSLTPKVRAKKKADLKRRPSTRGMMTPRLDTAKKNARTLLNNFPEHVVAA